MAFFRCATACLSSSGTRGQISSHHDRQVRNDELRIVPEILALPLPISMYKDYGMQALHYKTYATHLYHVNSAVEITRVTKTLSQVTSRNPRKLVSDSTDRLQYQILATMHTRITWHGRVYNSGLVRAVLPYGSLKRPRRGFGRLHTRV
jgi:hypothetical protein